jgi:AcrR family transcriptional regulator
MSGQTVKTAMMSSRAPSRPAHRAAAADQQRILAAAAEIADSFGLDALNTGRLAKRLRMRPGSLYKSFPNINAIIHALALRTFEEMIEMHAQATRDRAARPALEALANAQRTYAQARPGCYLAAVQAGQGTQLATKSLRERYLNAVATALQSYGLEMDAAIEVARCLIAVLQGFIIVELSGGVGTSFEADESFQRLLDMLDAGARAAGGTRFTPAENPVAEAAGMGGAWTGGLGATGGPGADAADAAPERPHAH